MIPNLQNQQLIAKGGQKEVYLAEHTDFGQVVFKKVFTSQDSIERTKREVRAVTLLDSPNVPKIFSHNCEEDMPDFLWVLEEYVEGLTLRETILNGRKYDIKSIVNFIDIMLNIAILSEKRRLVHRDIKPENIIIDSNDKFWLLDFGIARHLDLESITQSNAPFGVFTLGYASSEQFRNFKKDIDIRTDMFSIGIVAYEMSTGINPYRQGTSDPLMILRNMERVSLPPLRIVGDAQFQLSGFISLIGDIRRTRRPRTAVEAKIIFENVKNTLILV